MRTAFVLLLSLLATAAGAAEEGFCPPESPRSGGMRDIMLIYEGGKAWKPEEFRPYVAYVDPKGQPKDWFYDAFLFLMYGGAPSGATYIDGASNRADWVHFLDVTFAEGTCLSGLDREIAALGPKLGDPKRVVPVILMIPYPSARQKEFGDVDGDGVSEDLSKEPDRVKAVRWFLDEALARWRALAPKHLKLWGFYWMNEGISGRDEAIVKATAALIHEREYGFHWIPWYRAPGTEKWRELGIDFAVVQPNYAFTKPARGFVLGDDNRLTNNANDARALGLGVEIETPFAMPGDPAARWVFRQYLNHGVDELDGYLHGAVRAYYQGSDVIARLAQSAHPGERQLYDDLYRFHRGTYTRRPTSLVEGARCLLQEAGGKPRDEPKLTDGAWMTRPGREACLVTAKGSPVLVTVDLACPTLVDDVRVHLAAKADTGFPSSVRVLTAEAGSNAFTLRGETTDVTADRCGEWLAGFAAVHFPAAPAGRIRVELLGAAGEIALDEVVVPPAAQALWGVAARPEGDVSTGPETAALLTEGLSGGAAAIWRRGPARVTFDCRQVIGSQVRIRARKTSGRQALALRVRTSPASEWRKGEIAWQDARYALLTARLDPEPLDQLVVEVNGAGEIALEEAQMTPAANLARGMPYTLEPGFTAKYPDSGGELTDGKLCETSFADGKTVGWFGGSPSVILDLGAEREVDGFGVHVEGGGYAGVYAPVRVVASLSGDGVSWLRAAGATTISELTGERQAEGESCTLGWMRASFPKTRARFVRLDFVNRAWLMLSEVEVTSGGANVAAGCNYHLSPVPTSEQRYADKDTYLTDGAYAASGSGWGSSVGWSDAEPRITLDLLQARPVRLIRAHVSGGGQGAVWFPEEMRVELSTDGKSWSEPLVSRERAPESGKEHAVQFMSVRTPAGTSARFIRYSFKRRGWLMVDEVDVFGGE